jgi:hypothetical protein
MKFAPFSVNVAMVFNPSVVPPAACHVLQPVGANVVRKLLQFILWQHREEIGDRLKVGCC